jgi:predicted nucleotide-binding protein (sugar kinase/HSP70/actin superfamily)
MNSGIPNIFAKLGVKTYFQDMIRASEDEKEDIKLLLSSIHWKYAAKILEIASAVAKQEGLYPVLVTSFKCTPDSYVIEYFKQVLDAHDKPYLILQLDEHDSSVGYETRIEAATRAFRNHYGRREPRVIEPGIFADLAIHSNKDALQGKTVLLPNWDNITCTLLEAALRGHGIDARIVEESQESIMRSMSFNTGQCLPLNIIIQNTIDYIAKYNLDPEKTIVWSVNSQIACNIGMFPFYTKTMMEASGRGHEKIPVYTGDITFLDFSIMTSISSYLAFMFGGMLRKISCRLRPYEKEAGSTDRAVAESVSILYDAFEKRKPKEEALDRVMSFFEGIETVTEQRPKVAIFGDLYVRDNDIMNQDLVGVIERNGGEVVTTPYSELINIVADQYIKKWFKQGMYQHAVLTKVLRNFLHILDRKYYRFFNRVISAPRPGNGSDPESILSSFGLKIHHTGESMENILKIFHLLEHHPDLALFVQTNPSYCCPSLVTEAMADKIERLTGVPVVTIEYDGTGSSRNEDVIPYLKFPRKKTKKAFRDAI